MTSFNVLFVLELPTRSRVSISAYPKIMNINVVKFDVYKSGIREKMEYLLIVSTI